MAVEIHFIAHFGIVENKLTLFAAGKSKSINVKKKLLITGGSGTLGSSIIKLAIESGRYDVSTISTDPEKHNFPTSCEVFKCDLVTGEGLKNALFGVHFVIHCASNVFDTQRVDYDGTANLLKALDEETIENVIYVSIVGIDNSTYPYYMAKRQVEQLIANSGVPYSILRATQFHEFVLAFIKRLNATDHEMKVPRGLKFQSIAVSDLSEILLRMITSKPTGEVTSVGGLEITNFETMVNKYLYEIKGRQQIIMVDPSEPREVIFSMGKNVVTESMYGKITWASFLEGLKN